MKIALVHDYLREYGGAERVVETLHEMWPEAPLYTSFVDWPSFAKAPAGKADLFKSWDIRTSPLADNWLIKKFHSPLRFLAPWIWKSLDVSGYDVIISSSGWFMCRGVLSLRAKRSNLSNQEIATSPGFRRDPRNDIGVRPLHICYIHHPPRNLYGYATGRREIPPAHLAAKRAGRVGNFTTARTKVRYYAVGIYATIVNFFLRKYDWDTAQRVDYFIANSKETARRVEKFYRRKSEVIYPPVTQGSTLRTQGTSLRKRDYFLSVGRLTYSKRVDVAIAACNKLKLSLKVVGTGREEEYLRNLASQGSTLRSNIEFLGSVSDEKLSELYAGAKALIFCALDEDFGMVPVEAMAHGVPVIALSQGGVLETVIDGKTGVLFQKPSVESLVDALGKFDKLERDWEDDCRKQAKKFSRATFQKKLKSFVQEKYKPAT